MREGVDFMFADIKPSLHDFGVDFDVYFHENALHESKAVERAIARLRRARPRCTRPRAPTWLRTTDFGDDRDRVVIKTRRRGRRTSPATWRTTSTSASAGSSAT